MMTGQPIGLLLLLTYAEYVPAVGLVDLTLAPRPLTLAVAPRPLTLTLTPRPLTLTVEDR